MQVSQRIHATADGQTHEENLGFIQEGSIDEAALPY